MQRTFGGVALYDRECRSRCSRRSEVLAASLLIVATEKTFTLPCSVRAPRVEAPRKKGRTP